MSALQLPSDRLTIEGDHLITGGSTIVNIFELRQDDVPRFRNTEVSGLDRGRPEVPAMDPKTITLSGLIIGDVDLTMPTPGEHTYLRGGAFANWEALKAIFAQQFDVDTVTVGWQRLDESGDPETVECEAQVGNWQLTADLEVELTYTFEFTRFTDWGEGS